MSEELFDLSGLNNALRMIFTALAQENGYIDHGERWVAFDSALSYVEAQVLSIPGYYVGIRAEFVGGAATSKEVETWTRKQPRPLLGALEATELEDEDGTVVYVPAIEFVVRVDGIVAEFIQAVIEPFATAWTQRTIADVRRDGHPNDQAHVYRYDPASHPPQNAWLLMGDGASYPTLADLSEMHADALGGIYDTDWTAPKNGEAGDLALIYFIAPRKAACFVTRFATLPFWDQETGVNAVRDVSPNQWWVFTTPLIEIEPIPYADLRAAAGGQLLLKGRSGHYLAPATVSTLSFTARDPRQQDELDRVTQTPTGDPALPDPREMSFEQWRRIPSGALPLEAKVSEYLVEPLFRYSNDGPQILDPTLGANLTPEYRTPSGYVDFILTLALDSDRPILAIEVKLAVQRAASGVWSESPDFQQLRRYMDELGVPGLLIDAHAILLVKPGADAPNAEIVRAQADLKDLDAVAQLIAEALPQQRRDGLPLDAR
jgi:hypothetical protein